MNVKKFVDVNSLRTLLFFVTFFSLFFVQVVSAQNFEYRVGAYIDKLELVLHDMGCTYVDGGKEYNLLKTNLDAYKYLKPKPFGSSWEEYIRDYDFEPYDCVGTPVYLGARTSVKEVDHGRYPRWIRLDNDDTYDRFLEGELMPETEQGPIEYVILDTRKVDLKSVTNELLFDLIIGEGVFELPRRNVSYRYGPMITSVPISSAPFVVTLTWDSINDQIFVYEVDDESVLLNELTKRLESNQNQIIDLFNYYKDDNLYMAKGAEVVRRKFWEHHGFYDYDSVCSYDKDSLKDLKYYDYYFCDGNQVILPSKQYVDWIADASTNQDLKNDIRFSFYHELLADELVKKNPNIVNALNELRNLDFCERVLRADILGNDPSFRGAFLELDDMRRILGNHITLEEFDLLRINSFNRHVLLEGCDLSKVTLAGAGETTIVGGTKFGVRNYAFLPSLLLRNLDLYIYEDVNPSNLIAWAKLNYSAYNASNINNPFEMVFTPLYKGNYPVIDSGLKTEVLPRPLVVYQDNFKPSFTFFSDARIVSIEKGVVNLQDKFINNDRKISFNLAALSHTGSAIRSNPEVVTAGCLRVLDNDFCDSFINIRFENDFLVINIDGSSGDVDINNYINSGSGMGRYKLELSGSVDNPVTLINGDKTYEITGDVEINIASVTSKAGSTDLTVNKDFRLQEMTVSVNKGDFVVSESNNKYILAEGSDAKIYSILENKNNEWVLEGSSGSILLEQGSVEMIQNGVSVIHTSSTQPVLINDESNPFSRRGIDSGSLSVPEIIANYDDPLNVISLKQNNYVVSEFSDFKGVFRTSFDPLTYMELHGNLGEGAVIGFNNGWDIYRDGEELVFVNSKFHATNTGGALEDELLMFISPPPPDAIIKMGDKNTKLNQDTFSQLLSLLAQ